MSTRNGTHVIILFKGGRLVNRIISECIDALNKGSLELITMENCNYFNEIALGVINQESPSEEDLSNAYGVLIISNILYNNTTREILPLEDGIYDLLVNKYNYLTGGQSPVGAKPIMFDPVSETQVDGLNNGSVRCNANEEISENIKGITQDPVRVVRRVDSSNMVYFNDITRNSYPVSEFFDHRYCVENSGQTGRTMGDVEHKYPELVGTLDKCKYVLNSQAATHNESNGAAVWTFENNFMYSLYQMGIQFNELVAELKYDGVSVEAEIDGNTIISAASRGDTENNEARDLTPLFGGYVFPKAKNEPTLQPGKGLVFGMKFECIVTFENMINLEREFGISYANGRMAAIGLMQRNDARKFLPYLTLVPIRTAGLNITERQVEIEFLNKFYSSGVDMKYAILHADDYPKLLFMVKKFVDDAELLRPYMPFMYDGVVVSLTDYNLKQRIGRVHSVDKWSIAIKFEAEVKQTIFYGYTYTVGQNGVITPKAQFRPVAFMGNIQSEVSMHSFKRFKQVELKAGDIVRIEFRNDVMAYLTKPDNAYNRSNPNPIIQFPSVCPSCGTALIFTDKEAVCPNRACPERNLTRVANMFDKLNIKDFSKALISKLGITSLSDFVNYPGDQAITILGDKVGSKLMDRIEQFNSQMFTDYRMIGSIGFSSIAQSKWKLILCNISIEAIISTDDNELYKMLTTIKGIGPAAAKTIVIERSDLYGDLITISKMKNVKRTFGMMDTRLQVRFTGIRDKELEQIFIDKNFDVDGNKGVTKKTNILIVPYIGFSSSKTKNISPDCVVMDPNMARQYLATLH